MQMMPGVGLKLSAIFVKSQPPRWLPPLPPFLPPPWLLVRLLSIWQKRVRLMRMMCLLPLRKRALQQTSSKSICMPPSLLTYPPKHSQNRWLKTSNRCLRSQMSRVMQRWIWRNSPRQKPKQKPLKSTLKRHKSHMTKRLKRVAQPFPKPMLPLRMRCLVLNPHKSLTTQPLKRMVLIPNKHKKPLLPCKRLKTSSRQHKRPTTQLLPKAVMPRLA